MTYVDMLNMNFALGVVTGIAIMATLAWAAIVTAHEDG